jgi:predicted dehydrogenase
MPNLMTFCWFVEGGILYILSTVTKKVRWGILGVARIATQKVIPAMQQGEWSEITAIASRNLDKAKTAASMLKIPKAYGSYEELIADPDIEAVYNPLPNHLHVPWSIRAAEAGKHVLCEKPLALTVAEARRLLEVRNRTGVKMQEAFMVRTHPQWLAASEMIRSGRIGPVRSVMGYFSYFNDDPHNIRNIPEIGGGALMDIGCYLINTSRLIFAEEPTRVMGLIELDPTLKTDRLTSMILDYPSGQVIGTCSTQMSAYQRIHIFGTKGHIEIEIPFNAPNDKRCRVFVNDELVDFSICDQYRIQGDLFSKAVRDDSPVAIPLEDAIQNMKVIEAVFRSANSGVWEKP